MFVCLLGSCAQNKCQGKSGKHFHPFTITSKRGYLTCSLLLTWGGEQLLCPGAHSGGRQGGPVSSCPSNVLGLQRSQVSLLLHPFLCITPAKPSSTRLSTCYDPGSWGAKDRTWPC